MKKKRDRRKVPVQRSEEIELLRGNKVVSTITGAFGQSLRETRLTAMLGYIIALRPDSFLNTFGFRGRAQQILLETRHDLGRSDILIETSLGNGIIEAKIDATDPFTQSRRYPAKWFALVTNRVPQGRSPGKSTYVTWRTIASLLEGMTNDKSPLIRILSRDLVQYLQEHRMTRGRKAVEIYAREINEPVTLNLFLQAQLYGCKYEASSPLPEALYFAPHFGDRIANEHVGISTGISYIARIESVETAITWRELQDLLRTRRGSTWVKRNRELLQQLRQKWFVGQKEQLRSFVFLGKPQLTFNPPVKKSKLQSGKGFLSKRWFTFEQLLSARH